jgi:tRNA A-37 threonylcarbamoyl transferase component Bud32
LSDWIGRYRILRPLGEGGMGRIFLGEVAGASGFSRRVVVKVVRDELDAGLKQALLDEARLAASLVHRNVCPVLDLEEVGEQRLVILEHVDGMDLHKLLERRKRLPWELAAYVASEVAAGLDYAHRKSDAAGRPLHIVHRDVSPANILLSREGEVKLTDFGVAKFAKAGGGPAALKGNLGYMAPEQARGEHVDGRADVFALGVVLREALGGGNPYRGTTDLESLLKLHTDDLPPVRAHDVPEELSAIVAQASAIDRQWRFPTAAAMREALVNLKGQPADPARLLGQFLGESETHPTLTKGALMEAVLGGGRPLTQVRPADTVEELAPPDGAVPEAPPAHPGRGLLMAVAVLLFLGTGALAWVTLRRPKVPAASAATPPAKPPALAAAPAAPPVAATTAPSEPAFAPEPIERQQPRPRRGTLSVNAIPWANIFVDGRKVGPTPRLRLPLEAGRHHLRLVTKRGDTRTRVVDVAPGRESRVSINFADP